MVRRSALALAAVLAVGCARGETAPAARGPRVHVQPRRGPAVTVAVEVARTDADRTRGLMFRASLAPGTGMLFVFDEVDEHPFWMKNTLIALDMLFIDDAGRIVGVVARAAPGSLEPRNGGRCRYVLEVPGGWAEAHGVGAGDAVRFEGVLGG
jgi:uncharacterized membrane protein (UPF0127 family)